MDDLLDFLENNYHIYIYMISLQDSCLARADFIFTISDISDVVRRRSFLLCFFQRVAKLAG